MALSYATLRIFPYVVYGAKYEIFALARLVINRILSRLNYFSRLYLFRMTMRKLTSQITLAALVLGTTLLGGCGSKNTDSSTGTTTDSSMSSGSSSTGSTGSGAMSSDSAATGSAGGGMSGAPTGSSTTNNGTTSGSGSGTMNGSNGAAGGSTTGGSGTAAGTGSGTTGSGNGQ